MGGRERRLEWTIAEDEQVWQALSPALNQSGLAYAHPNPAVEGHAEQRLAAMIVLVGLLVAGIWMWQRQSAQAVFAGQLQAAVAQDTHVQQNSTVGDSQHNTLFVSAVVPGKPVAPRAAGPTHPSTRLSLPEVQVNDYDLVGERVMAQVTVSYPGTDGQLSAYRQTRFYRQTDGEWQRIEPDAALLGPWQTVRTAHFTLRHRTVDTAAVTEAAPRLDRLYEQLRHDVGLPIVPLKPDISVEISGDRQASAFTLAERALVAPSPALLAVPADMTASDILYEAMVYPLARLVVNEVIDQYPLARHGGAVAWWPLVDALPLWAMWDGEGLLASGRSEVVRWLLQNAQAATPSARKAVPDGYARLCHTYHIWNLAPAQMSVPLSCTGADQRWTHLMPPALPLRLDASVYAGSHPDGALRLPISGSQIVALETVIEYVAATYGRASLPRLIAAFGDHASWQSLIPEVFGISAAEFEAGWQAYLTTQYGSSVPSTQGP